MQNTLAKHPNVYVLMGKIWVKDSHPVNYTSKKTGEAVSTIVREISINFDDSDSGDRIFMKYTLWGPHVEEGDALKPLIDGKICVVFTHDQINWDKPKGTFTDKQGRPCREYEISDASFHPTGTSSKEVDEVAEASTTAPQPITNQDNQLNPYSGEDDL